MPIRKIKRLSLRSRVLPSVNSVYGSRFSVANKHLIVHRWKLKRTSPALRSKSC
ncbi:TPA_asm: hypothetical protein, partial [Porphyromonas phage phage024a_F0570]